MLYCDLQPAKLVYEKGENVTSYLKGALGNTVNTPEIIEIAYDLQAGSYIDAVNNNRESWRDYTAELSSIIGKYCDEGNTVLDVGTGEMTTLAGVAAVIRCHVPNYFACDISWSRLQKGREFLRQNLDSTLREKLHPFVANLFNLPFSDHAIDIVWTSHALEPNGGREKEALSELLRVARKKLILIEPYYEKNSPQGKRRMEQLGYIRGIPDVVEELGATCNEIIPIKNISNPLNPSYAFVVSPPPPTHTHSPRDTQNSAEFWACPATRLPMERLEDCYWSRFSMLAYPILRGIPILRPDAAILASVMK